MAKDEWYSRTVADSGQQVTGGAALLVRVKRGGGMKTVTQRIGEKAAQDMLDELNTPQLRLIKRKA